MDKEYLIEDVTRKYGKKQVLSGITMRGAAGECTGIAGTNGIGKSTLLRILAGVEKPDSGSLVCFGQDLRKDRKAFAGLIAYVPQENPLLEELTARDNLRLWTGKKMTGLEEEIRMLRIDEMLNTRISKMSGGMKRRVSIACALAGNSRVLIMDEPTAALDLCQKGIIMACLEDYRSRGGLIFLSTHDVEEMEFADRLYLLHSGTAAQVTAEEAATRIRSGEVD